MSGRLDRIDQQIDVRRYDDASARFSGSANRIG
jgi:hypothetical protein